MSASGETRAAQRVEKAGAELASSAAYAELLAEVRRRIAASRARAALSVNRELIELYWQIGREILRRQEERGWGAKVIDQLARDLKEEGHRGFSRSNLHYMRQFAAAWPKKEIIQAPSGQITWSHYKVLLDKLDNPEIRLWYAESAAAQCWSVRILEHQVATKLHLRQGNATTNFAGTLPAPDSELAQEMLRDPYDLSFLSASWPSARAASVPDSSADRRRASRGARRCPGQIPTTPRCRSRRCARFMSRPIRAASPANSKRELPGCKPEATEVSQTGIGWDCCTLSR